MPESTVPVQPSQLVQETKKGMSTGVKILIVCGVLVVLCMIVFAGLYVLGLVAISQAPKNETKVTQNLDSEKRNNPKALSNLIHVGDLWWSISNPQLVGTKLKNISGTLNNNDCVATSGQYLQIIIKVDNAGTDVKLYNDPKLYDSQNVEYDLDSNVASCVQGDMPIFARINPGSSDGTFTTFVAIYQVPTTASGFKFKVSDLKSVPVEFEYVSLGL